MAKTLAEMEALAGKLLWLSTGGKLTVALMMVQQGKLDVAESVIQAALEDLQARRLLNVARCPLTAKERE